MVAVMDFTAHKQHMQNALQSFFDLAAQGGLPDAYESLKQAAAPLLAAPDWTAIRPEDDARFIAAITQASFRIDGDTCDAYNAVRSSDPATAEAQAKDYSDLRHALRSRLQDMTSFIVWVRFQPVRLSKAAQAPKPPALP